MTRSVTDSAGTVAPEPGAAPHLAIAGRTSATKVARDVTRFLPVADEPLAGDANYAPAVWLVGAHGGAGTSTIAAMLEPFGDAGQRWPSQDEFPYCVIVCRSTRMGLDAAQSAVLQAQAGAAGPCEVLGILVIADTPGKAPKSLTQRMQIISDLTHVWQLPYETGLREARIEELATWSPSTSADTESAKKRQKKLPIDQEVPGSVAVIAEEIFDAAYKAHIQWKENN